MTAELEDRERGLWVAAWVSGLFGWTAVLPAETEMEKMRGVGTWC